MLLLQIEDKVWVNPKYVISVINKFNLTEIKLINGYAVVNLTPEEVAEKLNKWE